MWQELKNWPWITSVIVPIVIGGVSAWCAAHFAFRRYKSEKWWTLKSEKYAEATDTLHKLKERIECIIHDMAKESRPPVCEDLDRFTYLRDEFFNELEELRRIRDTSRYLVSEITYRTLTEFHQKFDNAEIEGNSEQHPELMFDYKLSKAKTLTNECLEEINRYRKSELKP